MYKGAFLKTYGDVNALWSFVVIFIIQGEVG